MADNEIKVIPLSDEERITRLKQLVSDGKIIGTSDALIDISTGSPLGLFVKEKNVVYYATPFGMPLFPCGDLQEYSMKIAKKRFLGELDKMLKAKTSILQKGSFSIDDVKINPSS